MAIDTNARVGNYETLNLKNVTRRQNVRSGGTGDKDSFAMGLVPTTADRLKPRIERSQR